MAAPFTSFESFTDDATPVISADFLNSIQSQGIAPAASVAWSIRPRIYAYSDDPTEIELGAVTVMCKDATTSKYGYATFAAQTLDDSLVAGGGGFSSASWHYVYAVLDNGTPSIEITIGAPGADLLTKNVDETRKYLMAFYVDGSGNIIRFIRDGFETRWQDRAHTYVFGDEGGGVGTFSTLGVSSLITPQRAPHARFLDLWIYATAGGTPYTLTLSFLGDSDAQARQIVATNSEYSWTQRIWGGGQGYVFTDVTNDLSAYGWIRVLGWTE